LVERSGGILCVFRNALLAAEFRLVGFELSLVREAPQECGWRRAVGIE